MMQLDFKKLAPHLLVILLFYVLTFAYFSPLFQGKSIRQSDVMNFKGMSEEIVKHREKHNEEPLWTNSMFGGMPSYQISTKYPNNWMPGIDKVFKGLFLPGPAYYYFTGMVCAYILFISLGLEIGLALLGAIAFSLSTYFMILIEAGHNTKAGAISYMPAVFAGFVLSYRGKRFLGAALVAFFLALELAQNHIQITYYLFMAIAIYALAEFIISITKKGAGNFIKSSAMLIIACALALGPNITNLLLTEEYSKMSTRGKSDLTQVDKSNQTSGLDRDYITQWSFDKDEVLTLLIPNYYGGATGALENQKEALKEVDPNYRQNVGGLNAYWGNQPFTSGPTYVGAIIVFLFVLGLFIVEGPVKWGLLAATLLSIMLSWGRHFMGFTNFFLDYFPGYNKFRVVAMILVIAELTIPMLAILTLKKILDDPEAVKKKMKQFYIAFGLTAGFSLLVYIMPDTFVNFWADGEVDNLNKQLKDAGFPGNQAQEFLNNLELARKSLLTSDAIRTFLFILLGAGTVLAFAWQKINKTILIGILCILVGIDLWSVNRRYLNTDNYVSKSSMEVPFMASAADQQILQDTDPNFRVFNVTLNPFSDASTSYFHKSIGGYHGAKLKRYQELIENHISKNNMNVINMLNTKYFIVKNPQSGEPMAQRNPGAMGNAWFVKQLKIVQNADSELNSLTNFNPKEIAFTDKKFEEELKGGTGYDSTATVKLASYKANNLVYESNSSQPGIVVFSEIYYQPGWNAYLDGKETPHARVNYVLRGMSVPAGKHKIEFKFEPKTYKTGQTIALISSILILAFVGGMIFLELKNKSVKPA